MFMRVFLLLCFTLITNASAHDVVKTIQTPMTVGNLSFACWSEERSPEAKGFCKGAIEMAYSLHGSWCVPIDVTHGQIQRKVKKALIDPNDSILKGKYSEDDLILMPAYKFIWEVIDSSWPCK
jgi:hypothetical protein